MFMIRGLICSSQQQLNRSKFTFSLCRFHVLGIFNIIFIFILCVCVCVCVCVMQVSSRFR